MENGYDVDTRQSVCGHVRAKNCTSHIHESGDAALNAAGSAAASAISAVIASSSYPSHHLRHHPHPESQLHDKLDEKEMSYEEIHLETEKEKETQSLQERKRRKVMYRKNCEDCGFLHYDVDDGGDGDPQRRKWCACAQFVALPT